MEMENIVSVERVKDFIKNGKTYREISEILRGENPTMTGLSERSIRRFCATNNINKKHLYNQENLDEIVDTHMNKVGSFWQLFHSISKL